MSNIHTLLVKCGLLHEANSKLPFSRPEANLHDDCESSLLLESNVVNDAPLTDLEEVFDSPLTSLPFVSPSFSSIPIDISVSDLTLLASFLHFTQCMGLEMVDISKGDASDIEDVLLYWSKELTLVEPYLKEFGGYVVMGSAVPSSGHTDPICTEPLNLTPISSSLLPTTPSNLHAVHESLGEIRGSYPSFGPCCSYLEDRPRKIMWSIFFDHAFDFSFAFDKFKRTLIYLLHLYYCSLIHIILRCMLRHMISS